MLSLASGLYPDAVGNGRRPASSVRGPAALPAQLLERPRDLRRLGLSAAAAGGGGGHAHGVASVGRSHRCRRSPRRSISTSSRGGRRPRSSACWLRGAHRPAARALAATLLAGAGAAGVVAVLLARHALVDGPAGSAEAAAQADSAALTIVALGVGLGLLWWAWCRLLDARVPRHLHRRVGPAALALCVVALLGVVMLGDPVGKLQDFRRPPQEQQSARQRLHARPSAGLERQRALAGLVELRSTSSRQALWWVTAPARSKPGGRGTAPWASSCAMHTPCSWRRWGELGLLGLALSCWSHSAPAS